MTDRADLRIESDLLDVGLTKHEAAALVERFQAGELPGLGLFVGWCLRLQRSRHFLLDGVAGGWYRSWRPSPAEMLRRQAERAREAIEA